MCRPGGRRCPGQYDPAHIAARNARRRELYHSRKLNGNANKEKIVVEHSSTGTDPYAKLSNPYSLSEYSNSEKYKKTVEKMKAMTEGKKKNLTNDPYGPKDPYAAISPVAPPKEATPTSSEIQQTPKDPYGPAPTSSTTTDEIMDLLHKPNDVVSTDPYAAAYAAEAKTQKETTKKAVKKTAAKKKTPKTIEPYNREEQLKKLNLSESKATGDLVDSGYVLENKISGTLNYNNLDENSYKAFGFNEVTDNYFDDNYHRDRDYDLRKISEDEIKNVTLDEKKVLNFYTGEGYGWMNRELYKPGSVEFASDDAFYKENFFEKEYYGIMNQDNYETTKDEYKKMVNTLDAAIEKAPKQQKIVYRGAKIHSESGQSFNMFTDPDGKKAAKWLDSNRALGTEIQFDAFTSSTPDFGTAVNFSHPGGILYEIMTPEGIGVESITQNYGENEVLLPREQRYMVVGKHQVKKARHNYKLQKDVYENYFVVQLVAINSKGEVLDGSNSEKPSEVK